MASMTARERYPFDPRVWVVVRGVSTDAEVHCLNAGLDADSERAGRMRRPPLGRLL
jgi:hypothetical protein